MNNSEAEEFKQLKSWRKSQGKDGYNPPWATKVKNVELGFKNRQVKFSDAVEKTQSSKKILQMAFTRTFLYPTDDRRLMAIIRMRILTTPKLLQTLE